MSPKRLKIRKTTSFVHDTEAGWSYGIKQLTVRVGIVDMLMGS